MEADLAIQVENVSKFYFKKRVGLRDFIRIILSGKPKQNGHHALKNISLDIPRGEVLGIIGKNGAGKSSLLKVLASNIQPSHGQVKINGTLVALLELGSGFHPELSGRQNVFTYASILGISQRDIEHVLDEIIEFSGLAEFIDEPVKTYSSGMVVRLAFSVASFVNPDIIIIDEALSVGDGYFAKKSFDKIMSFREGGKTIIFCSHSMYQVKSICDRVVWIDRGEIKLIGLPADVCGEYEKFIGEPNPEHDEPIEVKRDAYQGTSQVVPSFLSIDYADKVEPIFKTLSSDLKISIKTKVPHSFPRPSVIVAIVDDSGKLVSSFFSPNNNGFFNSENFDDFDYVTLDLCIEKLPLLAGHYAIDAYLMCERCVYCYEHSLRVLSFTVESDRVEQGTIYIPSSWT